MNGAEGKGEAEEAEKEVVETEHPEAKDGSPLRKTGFRQGKPNIWRRRTV